jgi:hypothetical protein
MITTPVDHADQALLRRFEPVIRYTKGERFFPLDVERYISQCSLWVQLPNEPAELLVPQGELTIEKLTQPRNHGFEAVYFLKFIDPLDVIELARYSLSEAVKTITHGEQEDVFHAGRGRLARVGILSRFLDALFSLTLLLRGRVTGDTATAAVLTYQRFLKDDQKYCYYGRVVRENGWLVLQYWLFYPFNNWRSGFFGVNDHEADWEMISIYCSEDERGQIQPHWLGYAVHDYYGDDLRRHWSDPEVEKVGEHPIVYAGAGSHASYFQPGEYLAETELPLLTPLFRVINRVRSVWVNTLRQGDKQVQPGQFPHFRVPFVDYARGDGFSIGPGQDGSWDVASLNPTPLWARDYRGLWGLYTRDPAAGENAPAGPMYNRDGTVRQSWYDPVGWAGLDKVPPPDEALQILDRQRTHSWENRSRLQREIVSKRSELTGLGLEMAAMEGFPHMAVLHERNQARLEKLSRELNELRRQITEEEAKLDALDWHETRLLIGDLGSLRSHIRRAHQPSSDVDLRLGRLAEAFAAISTTLLLTSIIVLIAFAQQYLLFGLAAMIGAIIFIESGFRRQLTRLIASLTVGLAIISAFVLISQFFWPILVATALVGGLYILWENIREMRSWG